MSRPTPPLTPVLARDRQRRRTHIYSALTRWPPLSNAVQAGLAAGIAYAIGHRLPDPLHDTASYAAMGAFTVCVPSVREGLSAAVRTAVSLSLGVLLALGLGWLTDLGSVVVGVAVLLGVLVSAWRTLGDAASWVPLGALFTLTNGGPDPQAYALGYVGQICLGATVGLLVNYAVMAQEAVPRLSRATADLRQLICDELAVLAGVLDGSVSLDDSALEPVVLATSRGELAMLEAAELTRSARVGYPSRLQRTAREEPLLALGTALVQCTGLVRSIRLTLARTPEQDGSPPLSDNLASTAAQVLRDLRDVFSTPATVTDPDDDRVAQLREGLEELESRVASELTDGTRRREVETLVSGARQALDVFVTAYTAQHEEVYGAA